MEQPLQPRMRPSTRWTSFEGWDYNGMKERLETALAGLNKDVLLSHAELIKSQKLSMSDNFSAGQRWICFEMVTEDGGLVIARVRLPRHPNTLPTVCEEDEFYAIACEVATMRFVGPKKLPSVVVPEVYAYEGPGSQRAAAAGGIYMLLEGFYGNTLQDVAFNLCDLPVNKDPAFCFVFHDFGLRFISLYPNQTQVASQDHIMTQWTKAQAQLATLSFPQIGSIITTTESGEPVFGKLSTAAAEGLDPRGPFSTATEYFTALGKAALRRAELQDDERSRDSAHSSRLGALVFLDIVQTTGHFRMSQDLFPFNHMDLGMQNILVDDDFNFLAIIDWEFAQTAPWQVNHYPMPFSGTQWSNYVSSTMLKITTVLPSTFITDHFSNEQPSSPPTREPKCPYG